MDLFIRISGGKPFEHPIFGDNFREAFPEIDVNNLPDGFARFVRVPRPALGPFEKNQTLAYEWVNGVVMDIWRCEQMTDQEKADKLDQARARQPFPSWTFDETLCQWNPPIEYPSGGLEYKWDESILNWVKI